MDSNNKGAKQDVSKAAQKALDDHIVAELHRMPHLRGEGRVRIEKPGTIAVEPGDATRYTLRAGGDIIIAQLGAGFTDRFGTLISTVSGNEVIYNPDTNFDKYPGDTYGEGEEYNYMVLRAFLLLVQGVSTDAIVWPSAWETRGWA